MMGFELLEMLISTAILAMGVVMFRTGRPRIIRKSYLETMSNPELFIKATGITIVVMALLVDAFVLVHHYFLPGVTKIFDPAYYIVSILAVCNLVHYGKLQRVQKTINDKKKQKSGAGKP